MKKLTFILALIMVSAASFGFILIKNNEVAQVEEINQEIVVLKKDMKVQTQENMNW